MAKKKYEFKPDKLASGIISKLYVTRKVRLSILRWVLYALVLLVVSLLQDVILCHLDIFSATTDLVPCAILLISMLLGAERCSLFALIGSALYQFSGTGPGYQSIAIITALCIFGAMFRQSYLRRGFFSCLFCTAICVMVYELFIFGFALLLGQTHFWRIYTVLITGVLTLISVPVLYPITSAIDKIGGDTWKD